MTRKILKRNVEQRKITWFPHEGMAVKTALTGRNLQGMGLLPGPLYTTILGKLLDARIDGTITTEAEERVFLQKWLGNQNVRNDC